MQVVDSVGRVIRLTSQRTDRVAKWIPILGLVLSVEYQRKIEQCRHLWRQRFLTEHKRLERVKQVLYRETREQAMDSPVRRAEIIVEACMDPRFVVAAAPVSVDIRRPRD